MRCPDRAAAEKMRARIEEIIHAKDTLGGVLEIVALNVPVGLGSFSQWDKRLEAKLAMAIMSVQAIKGVEIGDAFENAKRLGTQAHDFDHHGTFKPATFNKSRGRHRRWNLERMNRL